MRIQVTPLEERATPAVLPGHAEMLDLPRIEIVVVACAQFEANPGVNTGTQATVLRTDLYCGGASNGSTQDDVLAQWLTGEDSADEEVTVAEPANSEPEVDAPEPTAPLLDSPSVVFVADAGAESPGE